MKEAFIKYLLVTLIYQFVFKSEAKQEQLGTLHTGCRHLSGRERKGLGNWKTSPGVTRQTDFLLRFLQISEC